MSLVLIYMGVMADGVICTERSTFKRDPNLRRLSRKGVPLLMFAVCGLRFAVCGLRFAVCGLRVASYYYYSLGLEAAAASIQL